MTNLAIPSSGDVQAAYWNGPLTRKEAQNVFDEYAQVLTNVSNQTTAMNMTISFLCERFGIKPEDVASWIRRKAAEQMAEAQKNPQFRPVSPAALDPQEASPEAVPSPVTDAPSSPQS